jgi:hypothetical protein
MRQRGVAGVITQAIFSGPSRLRPPDCDQKKKEVYKQLLFVINMDLNTRNMFYTQKTCLNRVLNINYVCLFCFLGSKKRDFAR